MSGSRHVVVAGARSQVGVFLLPRLLEAGHRVTALSREPGSESGAADQLTWTLPEDGPGNASGLVSCGPLWLARRLVDQGGALEIVIAFSTTSILSKRTSGDRAERRLVNAIVEDERALKKVCGKRGIALTLLRPTLVYGCGRDRNLTRLLRLGERTGFIPLSSRADGLRQPVHAEDLASLAVTALERPGAELIESPVCGSTTLSYRHMLEKTAACGRRPIRLLPLHPAIMIPLVKAAALTGVTRGVNPEMVRRQAIDLVFDDIPARETLGWNPRPFDPSPTDFQLP